LARLALFLYLSPFVHVMYKKRNDTKDGSYGVDETTVTYSVTPFRLNLKSFKPVVQSVGKYS